MNKQEEIKTINIQLFGIIISLLTIVFSLITTYNQKLKLEKKKTILNPKNSLRLTIINRILILIVGLIFLYVNYNLYNISKRENENLKSYILQIIASYLTIISALIAFYVVTLSSAETVSDVENPII